MLDSSLDRLFDREGGVLQFDGRLVGPYRVERRVSEGLYCDVFLARDPVLLRDVALKILKPGPWLSDNVIQRFRQEGQILAKLRHPNIVLLLGIHEIEELLCLVMEFIDGGNLADFVRSHGKLSAADACGLMLRVSRAVAAAHHVGVVHRDLKPQNILLDRSLFVTDLETVAGFIKVGDFGVAKLLEGFESLTRTGQQSPGTAAYMAPEQIEQGAVPIGPPADVHALGVIIYSLITGKHPFQTERLSETFDRILHLTPEAPSQLATDIPAWLDEFCATSLAKSPDRRFRNAHEAAEFLHRNLRTAQLAAMNIKPEPRPAVRLGTLPAHDARPEKASAKATTLLLIIALIFFSLVLLFRLVGWPEL